MSNPLVEAIYDVLQFVSVCKENGGIHESERDRFGDLSERVWVLAQAAGVGDALPKVSELAPQVNFPDMAPAHFEGLLNLPGEWPEDFDRFVFVDQRWQKEMDALLKLAKASPVAAPSADEKAERRLAALRGIQNPEVWRIAESDESNEDKMLAIFAIDKQFRTSEARFFADIFGVTTAAIRKMKTWKNRKKLQRLYQKTVDGEVFDAERDLSDV